MIQVIVVDVPDRLGRGDAIAQCEMLAKLSGCRIEYVNATDLTTVEGLVQHSAEQMVSGIERINISRRTNGGKKRWVQQGRVVSTRRPYGYQLVTKRDDMGRVTDRQLVIDEKEAEVVRHLYEWVGYETLTLGQVSRRLDELQIPRMSSYDDHYGELGDKIFKKRQRWSVWSRDYIGKIIRSSLYRGEWQYGKDRHKRIDTPNGIKSQVSKGTERISINVPRIVSDNLWQLANDQLDENKKRFYRKAKREYLLRGRIRCGVCGRMMSGSAGNYRCPVRDGANYYNDPAHVCNNKRVLHQYIDTATWSAVREALLDENRMWGAVNQRTAEAMKVRETLGMSLSALQLRIQKERDKIGRLLDLYAAGDIDRTTYLAKCKNIEDGIASLSVQIQDLEKRIDENPVILPEQEEALRAFQREIVSRMADDVPVSEKRKLIDLLRIEVTWNGLARELTITGLIVNSLLNLSSA